VTTVEQSHRRTTPHQQRASGADRRSPLARLKADRAPAWALALGGAAGYGVLAGWWTPRGPITTVEGLSAMALGLAVGFAAGLVLRSRWAMVVTPAVFAATFELVRLDVSGPTVDGIHLGSELGIVAFVVGRGVHGLLALLPMVLGACLGAALARRGSAPVRSGALATAGLWSRRAVAALTGLALVALAAFVARPATTAPIVDEDGRTVAGSVAELTQVRSGGHDLDLMVRGRSVDNPVMLFLAGGPGGSELGAMRRHSQALEDDFVVATLDQRGTGKSYDELDPSSTLTLDQTVQDVLSVAGYLRDRFDEEKVYLVGQSGGTVAGVLAVERDPQAFHAFVGVGQMVDPVETDEIYYRDALAWARESGDTDLVDTLTRNGPPPYTDTRRYEPALGYEHELYPYDHSGNSEGAGQMGENIFVEEYTLLEQLHVFGAVMDVFDTLYPQLQHLDFRLDAARLDVPVYLALGAHETPGRAGPAEEWFDVLEAPHKELVVFETSGHRPLWEQPAEFADLMADVRADSAEAR
jgi:pimeloyl-ACP methyl ester carboxylesterase